MFKRTITELTFPDFKTSYKATDMRPSAISIKIDKQINRTESSETDLHTWATAF